MKIKLVKIDDEERSVCRGFMKRAKNMVLRVRNMVLRIP